MRKFIEERLEEQEAEWENPLGERLLKLILVGAAGLLASWAAEKTFDQVVENRRQKKEVDMLESMLEH
jgi:hypothetical protein